MPLYTLPEVLPATNLLGSREVLIQPVRCAPGSIYGFVRMHR
jgi:hypothetical protein